MKKNLRNILAVALGLITTVSFAQDWGVDSRTRIDMSGDNDKMSTEQRATVGATWGGSDWGIHTSTEINYVLGPNSAASLRVYEAYASANVFGFANMTAGRQALDYGSGALMSSNQWAGAAGQRTTWDGFTFAIDNDMLDLTIGYASQMTDAPDTSASGGTNMHINASKAEGDWSVNLLYMTKEGQVDGEALDGLSAYGLDLGYNMMGGQLGINASMNQDYDENQMTSYGATYNVNDNLSISLSQTSYVYDEGTEDANGENATSFNMAGTNMAGDWFHTGNMGYLGAGDEDMTIGVSYNMGGITLGANMHTISNSENEDYERSVTDISLGYDLGDNASIGLRYATDTNDDAANDGAGAWDNKYTWVTLTVNP